MKLRVRTKDVTIDIGVVTITLPDAPDWVMELTGTLPGNITGKVLYSGISGNTIEIAIEWVFTSNVVEFLAEKLRNDATLASATVWEPSTFNALVGGLEMTANGQIGISVER